MQTCETIFKGNIAEYFAAKPLYLNKEKKKPSTCKLVEQLWQQTKGEMWYSVIAFFKTRRCLNDPTVFKN